MSKATTTDTAPSLTATEFARRIIEGSGGMNDYEDREMVAWYVPERVAAATWTMRCLANPDCEGSGEALAAILARRGRMKAEKANRTGGQR